MGLIHRYRAFLPVTDQTPLITLYEGDTPLIPVPRFSAATSPNLDIRVKFDGMNPTGSFKDRGMTMALSKAVEAGAKAVICASTGNTSAAAAAYAARAGLDCLVLLPNTDVASGKLSQALIHGARVVAVEGTFDDALRVVRDLADRFPLVLVNHINPFRIQGQKTAAFEICDDLGEAPDYHVMPVGNAGNITAYWLGFKEYKSAGLSTKLPKMIGFQAAGSAPIVDGAPVLNPQTIATAIRIGNPASWEHAISARNESGGLIDKVTDDEILEAYKMLASTEGIFAEPASLAPIAGITKLAKSGYFGNGAAVVTVTLTGHGLKDPERAMSTCRHPVTVPATPEALIELLGY